MTLAVFAIVLAAALLHAGWNAIVKAGDDKFLTTILVTAVAALISALLLPFLRAPAMASWPFALLSALIQIGYFLLVARTYQAADMSQTYPLMRGTAPLIVALASVFLLHEALSAFAWCGVIAICLGILTMALGTHLKDRKGTQLALLNALLIAGYTLVDGIGVRRSGAPAAYTLWLFLLVGLPFALWGVLVRRASFLPYVRRYGWQGITGGIGTSASYGLALWAMTRAPLAVVAALRETSILFGVLIAGLLLREPVGPRRILSACIIAGGAALLRLS
jgi:drug/metabolite transporter (DMT)-like permease